MNVRDKVGGHFESYFNHLTRVSNKMTMFFSLFPEHTFSIKIYTIFSIECFLEIYIVASHSHLYNSNFKICCKLHNFVFFGKENLFTRRERNKTLNIIPFRFNVAGRSKKAN